MEIPRVLLDEYTAQLNALSKAGQKLVLNALQNAEWNTIAELRNIMIGVMNEVCAVVADDAAVVASELYDDVREMSIGKRLDQIADSSFDDAATAGAVRALVQSVVETGDTVTFGRNLASRVDYEIKKAAGEATYKLAARDPSKPRFARVPSGAETCPFCIMLASRGFAYHNNITAGADGHYHANCDCRIVPGFEGTKVQGYDPDNLYARYKDCVDALDDNWVYHQYETLPEEKRSNIAFDEFKTKQVLAEMGTRNPEWLNRNIPGDIKQENGARPLPKERIVAKWLSQHGFDVEFRATRSAESKKTSDIYIRKQVWEIKQPTGNGKQTIYHQFEEAALQSDRLIIDISEVTKPESGGRWTCKTVEKEVQRLIKWHFKGVNGKTVQFVEVLLVNDDYLKRYKKGS